jgi:DedD protein
MHDHNLDDLIIDNIEPKNSKTKSFLTIIALLIVVLIVAIILTKILLKTPNSNGLAFEENTTEMIAPELQLKETPKSQKEKEAPSLSKIIESKLKAPVVETKKPVVIEEPAVVIKKEKAKPEIKLPEVPKAVETKKEPVLSNILDQEIKAPAPETKKPVIVQEPLSTIKEKEAKNAADIAYWEAVQEKRKSEKIAKESVTLKEPTVMIKEEKTEEVVKEAVQIKEPVKPKKIKTPKPVVTPVKKPVKKPVATKPAPKTVSTKRYYVQVGAYRNKPSTRFMSVIRNNGYKYRITKPDTNGIKKVLIGPYRDRASVNRALIQVRDRIHKRAFVVKR